MLSKDHVPLSSQSGRFHARVLSGTVPEKQRRGVLTSIRHGRAPVPDLIGDDRHPSFFERLLRRWMDTRVKPAYDAILSDKDGLAQE